jgi:predicted Zn-dependent peptidase
MSDRVATLEADFTHAFLDNGVEFAVDHLPQRTTVAMHFRMLTGVADDPPELTGIGSIIERTLAKGTSNYDGQALADAFDRVGAQWATASGRQSMLVRVLCLPEFTSQAIDLVAEMICRPAFPDDACRVAVQLAQEELKHLDDDPLDLLRIDSQRLTLGPVYGRFPGGQEETLPRITPELVRKHWNKRYRTGRLQVAIAGPADPKRIARQVSAAFKDLPHGEREGRGPVPVELTAARHHRSRELKQEYMVISLPGAPRGSPDYPIEQVLLGVLSGGMSARLFTEVREKQGLVYWVGAWHEQPRGLGIMNLGASTTPERCEQTYNTLLRESQRLGADLTREEADRARNSLMAHLQTEDDLTRARAGSLSDDLFHFSRPVGPIARLEALKAVTLEQVADYARRLPHDRICLTTLGPRELTG